MSSLSALALERSVPNGFSTMTRALLREPRLPQAANDVGEDLRWHRAEHERALGSELAGGLGDGIGDVAGRTWPEPAADVVETFGEPLPVGAIGRHPAELAYRRAAQARGTRRPKARGSTTRRAATRPGGAPRHRGDRDRGAASAWRDLQPRRRGRWSPVRASAPTTGGRRECGRCPSRSCHRRLQAILLVRFAATWARYAPRASLRSAG